MISFIVLYKYDHYFCTIFIIGQNTFPRRQVIGNHAYFSQSSNDTWIYFVHFTKRHGGINVSFELQTMCRYKRAQTLLIVYILQVIILYVLNVRFLIYLNSNSLIVLDLAHLLPQAICNSLIEFTLINTS